MPTKKDRRAYKNQWAKRKYRENAAFRAREMEKNRARGRARARTVSEAARKPRARTIAEKDAIEHTDYIMSARELQRPNPRATWLDKHGRLQRDDVRSAEEVIADHERQNR